MLWAQNRGYIATNIQDPCNKLVGLSGLGNSGEQYSVNSFIVGTILLHNYIKQYFSTTQNKRQLKILMKPFSHLSQL